MSYLGRFPESPPSVVLIVCYINTIAIVEQLNTLLAAGMAIIMKSLCGGLAILSHNWGPARRKDFCQMLFNCTLFLSYAIIIAITLIHKTS